ncbi:DUF3313 domain-containing protein [uncultured Desulfosarcina sp.]|uniref:DUF3313 domain-containing protein n=1 Tax=uncultured Desulfosarcina sp. TaxID=218289 RepID=UPI0029C8BD18|nr:DUF3313 domain-containing protein [uncultured Desulfosarcina sp.]
MKKTIVLVIGILLLTGCATKAPQNTGFLGEYYKDLTPAPKDAVAKLRWIKPGVDFTRYKKVMVDYVLFALDEDSEYKAISGEEMKKLGDAASLALVNAIKEGHPVVSEPGPDVCRLRTAIVGLKQSHPALSGISTVIPIGMGISVLKKGATGSWSGAGGTQAEAMLIDSQTNEVIAAGYLEYKAGFTERFTKWGSVEDAFEYWGETGAKALEATLSAAKK